jgi:hypothetical protein
MATRRARYTASKSENVDAHSQSQVVRIVFYSIYTKGGMEDVPAPK